MSESHEKEISSSLSQRSIVIKTDPPSNFHEKLPKFNESACQSSLRPLNKNDE